MTTASDKADKGSTIIGTLSWFASISFLTFFIGTGLAFGLLVRRLLGMVVLLSSSSSDSRLTSSSFFARPVTDKVRVPVNHKLAWFPAVAIVEFFEALLKLVIATLDEVLLVI